MRVPTLDQPRVQSQPFNAPSVSVNAPSEAFGGGSVGESLAQSSTGIATSLTKFAAEQKKLADDAQARDYDSELIKVQSNLYGKMQSMRGKDAAGVLSMIDDEWTKSVSKLDKMLVNPEQQRAGKESSVSRYMTLYSQAQRHTADEMFRYNNESAENNIKLSQMSAAEAYQDEGAIQKSLANQRKSLEQLEKQNGKGKEWLQLAWDESQSKTHAAIINRYLANEDDVGAENYFKRNEKNITVDKDKIKELLESGSIRGNSQRAVDTYLEKGLTETQAREQAKNDFNSNPRLREATEQRIESEYGIRKRAEDVANQIKLRGLYDQMDKTKQMPTEDQMYGLSDSQKKSVLIYLKSAQENSDRPTNTQFYYGLQEMAADPYTRKKFIEFPLEDHINEFSRKDYDTLFNLRTKLRNKEGDSDVASIAERNRVVNGTLLDMGIDPSAKGTEKKKRIAAFNRALDSEIFNYMESSGGKKPSVQEIQGMADRLAGEVVTDRGFFYDTKKRLFEADEGTLSVDIEDIPRGERVKIERALKSRGIPVTDENVITVYQDKIGAK